MFCQNHIFRITKNARIWSKRKTLDKNGEKRPHPCGSICWKLHQCSVSELISSISHWRICSVLLPGSHQVPNVQDPWDSQDVNCQIASSWCGLDIFISQAQHTTTIFYNISLATQAACKHISIYIYIKPGDTSPSRWLDTLMKPNVREFIKFRNCFSCTHFVLLMGKCCKLTGTWNTGSRLVLHSFFPTRAMVCLESASS